jgi:hypothetical protein
MTKVRRKFKPTYLPIIFKSVVKINNVQNLKFLIYKNESKNYRAYFRVKLKLSTFFFMLISFKIYTATIEQIKIFGLWIHIAFNFLLSFNTINCFPESCTECPRIKLTIHQTCTFDNVTFFCVTR